MQLCLIHNDPFETLLATADGEPVYSIYTLTKDNVSSSSSPLSSKLHPRLNSPDSNSSSSSSSSNFSTVSGVTSASNSSTSTTLISSTEFTPTKSPPSPPLPARVLRNSLVSVSASRCVPARPHHQTTTAGARSIIPVTRTHSSSSTHHHRDSSVPRSSPHTPHQPASLQTPVRPACANSGPVTSVHRLERPHYSRGNVETEVGRIEYCGDHIGTRVQLCHTGMEISAPARYRSRTPSSSSVNKSRCDGSQENLPYRRNGLSDANTVLAAFQDFVDKPNPMTEARQTEQSDEEQEFIPNPVWEFKGPDNRPYKWMTLANCPFLVHNTSPVPTPIARYRPAKLGIISRSRKAFLEIMPSGLNLEDMVVVTFVGYFRMWLGDTSKPHALPATITSPIFTPATTPSRAPIPTSQPPSPFHAEPSKAEH